MLLSGAFLLALVLLGIVLATTAGTDNRPGDPVNTQPTAAQAAAEQPPTTQVRRERERLQPCQRAVRRCRGRVRRRRSGERSGRCRCPKTRGCSGRSAPMGRGTTCFAHDPSGALLAAMNLWAEGTAVAPSELFARLAIGAPRNLGSDVQLDSDGPIQFAGYRYGSYTPAVAQVAIVFRGPEGKLLAVATTMVWAGGDWKYLFPPDGTPAMQVLGDLTGYVQWSGF